MQCVFVYYTFKIKNWWKSCSMRLNIYQVDRFLFDLILLVHREKN